MRSGAIAGRSVPPYRPQGPQAGYGRPRALRPPTQAALRRRQAQKRRRDIFFALTAGTIGSLLLAFILPVMWPVQLIFDAGLAGYVMLLVRMRSLAAEREMKLTFMPTQARRGRPAYDIGGYGEMELRRAAN
jgi:hypothetical protein